MQGELTTVRTVDGKQWRWQFISTGGREDISPRPYKTAKLAQAAGERWLETLGETKPG